MLRSVLILLLTLLLTFCGRKNLISPKGASVTSRGALSAKAPFVGDTEYWGGINQDGNSRNSNPSPLGVNLRIRWIRDLKNFFPFSPSTTFPPSGQRSLSYSVRNGTIALIIPSTDPDADLHPSHYATVGLLSLLTGETLLSQLTQHRGASALFTYGLMDNDAPLGTIIQHWNSNGLLYFGHGSDLAYSSQIDPLGGDVPVDSPAVKLSYGPNASGYFQMINSNPALYARGGGGGHTPFTYGVGGEIGGLSQGIESLKMYNSYVLGSNAIYSIRLTNQLTTVGYGVKISEYQYVPNGKLSRGWTYTDPTLGVFGVPQNHGMGAPVPMALTPDDTVLYYGFNTTGSGTSQTADLAQGGFLVGVKEGVEVFKIPTGHNPLPESYFSDELERFLFPQLAVSSDGRYAVVFQPQQRNLMWDNYPVSRGHVFLFDLAQKTLIRHHAFSPGYFQTDTDSYRITSGGIPRYNEQAVQMTIAGDKAYVLEPLLQGGTLRLRIGVFGLSDGSFATSSMNSSLPISDPLSLRTREWGAVDGTLLALIDYDEVHQALIALEGDQTQNLKYPPFAGISPAMGTTLTTLFSDYPMAPTHQWDTGSSIPFSAKNSFDPDGGTLSYAWDFADGNTSVEKEVSHSYTTQNTPGSITPYQVKLSVSDEEGDTTIETKSLLIRDAGDTTTIRLTPVEDAYVNYFSTKKSINYGAEATLEVDYTTKARDSYRSFIKFDIPSHLRSSIVSARLRLHARDYSPYFNEPMIVKASSSSWSELTITGANAPLPGDSVGEVWITSPKNQFHIETEIPISPYVIREAPMGSLSLVLEAGSAISFFSKENQKFIPELILKVGTPPFAPPTFITEPPASLTSIENFSIPLSVLADSVQGESALTYHWRQLSGPLPLGFSDNHTKTAKDVTIKAPSTQSGTYRLLCTVFDGFSEVESEELALDVTVVNEAPVIVSMKASATLVRLIISKTSVLSVAATDDDGEANLKYTWKQVGNNIPAPVTFSSNGTHAARNSTVTFSKAGIYYFQVDAEDSHPNYPKVTTSTKKVKVEVWDW